jgi:hypothetical protein
MNVNTGMKYVTKETVGSYLLNKDSWEGSSTAPVVFTPPKTISLPQGQGTGN